MKTAKISQLADAILSATGKRDELILFCRQLESKIPDPGELQRRTEYINSIQDESARAQVKELWNGTPEVLQEAIPFCKENVRRHISAFCVACGPLCVVQCCEQQAKSLLNSNRIILKASLQIGGVLKTIAKAAGVQDLSSLGAGLTDDAANALLQSWNWLRAELAGQTPSSVEARAVLQTALDQALLKLELHSHKNKNGEPPHRQTEIPSEEIGFFNSGGIWTICYKGKTLMSKSYKGFKYLDKLIRRPHVWLTASDLEETAIVENPSNQPLCDKRARRECLARLEELKRERDQAITNEDRAWQSRLDEETNQIEAYLHGATCRGKILEFHNGPRYKQWNRVRKNMSSATQEIGKTLPELKQHLDKAIKKTQINYSFRYKP